MSTQPTDSSETTCVVVSWWTGHERSVLFRLLDQMLRVEAGSPFALVIACNGGDQDPLSLPARYDSLRARVINRVNAGYNIGAWQAGYEAAPGHRAYLFLQDECFLKRAGWLSEFEYRFFTDRGIGLLGEALMWDRESWPYIRAATDRDLGTSWFKDESMHPLDFYREFMTARGIEVGEVGTHLQSLVLFTSDAVLKEIGGLPVGNTYREAVACEIGISRVIEARGYRIAQLKSERFSLIGHQQWTTTSQLKSKARQRVVDTVKRIAKLALPQGLMPSK